MNNLNKDEVILEVKNLTKIYDGRFLALDKVNFSIKKSHQNKGIIHGFIGPNGAGKTTLIKALMKGIIADLGEIYLKGSEISDDEYINEKAGFSFEKLGFYNDIKLEQLVYLTAEEKGVSKVEAESLLSKSELRNHREKKCGELSVGWSKILLYFLAMMKNPKIIFLDEPTSGLDPTYRYILLRQLEKKRDEGKTILISSHILSDLQKIVDTITIINRGVIVYTGEKPEDIEKMYEEKVLGLRKEEKIDTDFI